MEHFIVLYNFLALTIGIVFLCFAFYIHQKESDSRIKSFIYFYSTFSIIAVIELLAVYIKTNCFPDEVKLYAIVRYLGNPVGLLLLFFSFPYFIHTLVSAKNTKIKNTIFGVTAIILLIVNYSISLFSEFEATNYLRILSKDFIFIAMILYCFIQTFMYFNKLTDKKEKRFFLRFVVLFGLFIPGIVLDTFLTSFPTFKAFPVIYVVTGFLFIKYLYSNTEVNRDLSQFKLIEIPFSRLENQFGLTFREIEIIKFVADGLTNNKIAEELFISVNTVKSHLRNSYQKLEVTNRIELINLLNNLPEK